MVVHGEDGLDEITTTAGTFVSEMHKGELKNFQIHPKDFGFKGADLEELSGGDASINAKILLDILNGKPGPKRDIVILNAAAAIYVADKANSIQEGIKLASGAVDSGKALEKLELLKEYSSG
jgi:anthranilate phosphoribosyltransferase